MLDSGSLRSRCLFKYGVAKQIVYGERGRGGEKAGVALGSCSVNAGQRVQGVLAQPVPVYSTEEMEGVSVIEP